MQERPLDERDAMLCIRNIRAAHDGDAHLMSALLVGAGARLHRDDPLVRANPDAFVPIVAEALTAANAVRARGDRWETRKDSGGKYIRYDPATEGQLISTFGEIKRFLMHRAGCWVSRESKHVQERPQDYEVII